MKNSEFVVKVKKHLGKKSTKQKLGIPSNMYKYLDIKGLFNNAGYSHILSTPLCTGFSNSKYSKYTYFDTYRDEIVNQINTDGIKLHRYQKNLNSSQGVALNFFLPIEIESRANEMCKFIFGIEDIKKINLEVSMNDSGGGVSQTEVDCILTEENGMKHLFEIKYTETGFGRIKDEPKYKAKWDGSMNQKSNLNINQIKVKYSEVLELFDDNTIDYEFFLKNYQLVRNLYNTFFKYNEKKGAIERIENPGTMNCIFSKRNNDQYKEFMEFKKNLKRFYYKKLNLYYWEDVTEKAIKVTEKYRNTRLNEHYKKFKEFYLEF
jgi:hypothetical protein